MKAIVVLQVADGVATALAEHLTAVVDLVYFGAFEDGRAARLVHLVAKLNAHGQTLLTVEFVLIRCAYVAHEAVHVELTRFRRAYQRLYL